MIFIDALYGEIELDIPLELLQAPELQRLREVRLCNINSPYVTGGTSLNRFEHAIGTAYLAQEYIKSYTHDPTDQNAFIIAALLHDIVTAPFGHSLEYLYETLRNNEYEHANIWQMIFTGKTIPSSRNFFIGKKVTLPHLFEVSLIEKIRNILEMKHPLSKILTNDIDIDNIDNVFRFAYHIGLSFQKSSPVIITKNLKYKNQLLSVSSEALPYFKEWFVTRKKLYYYLLENEGEFIAKALLERALIECFIDDNISEYDWVLTDSEMIEFILKNGNATARKMIQRLMLMDFPEQRKVLVVKDYQKIDELLSTEKLNLINFAFSDGVLLHFIRDVNKTCRQLKINLDGNINDERVIGYVNDRYLIGLFADNSNAIRTVEKHLKGQFDTELFDIKDYNINEVQISLFEN